MHLHHRGGGAAGFLWLDTESRFRGIKGGNAAGWGVEAAVGRGGQRGIGGWSSAAVIRGLDWCGGDVSGLILQVWHLRQLQRWEGCSSLAARTWGGKQGMVLWLRYKYACGRAWGVSAVWAVQTKVCSLGFRESCSSGCAVRARGEACAQNYALPHSSPHALHGL